MVSVPTAPGVPGSRMPPELMVTPPATGGSMVPLPASVPPELTCTTAALLLAPLSTTVPELIATAWKLMKLLS